MKNRALIEQLLNWKLSDLIDSYGINISDDVETDLNNLIEHLVRDIKEE